MLLPALTSARERAKQLVCQSNLKQVFMGAQAYIDNGSGWLPKGDTWPLWDGSTAYPYWIDYFADTGYNPPNFQEYVPYEICICLSRTLFGWSNGKGYSRNDYLGDNVAGGWFNARKTKRPSWLYLTGDNNGDTLDPHTSLWYW